MKFEVVRGCRLPKIGFGTWNIGGGHTANRRADTASLSALRSALELGYTHFDTAEMYADGHTEELLGQAVRDTGTNRESLFIASKVNPGHLDYAGVTKALEASLRRLGMSYLDLYLIHWPNAQMRLADTFRALNRAVRDGRVRHLGVSNFDVGLLEQSLMLSETPLLTNQVPYSVTERSFAKNGVLDYCQQHDMLLTAYSPLGQGRLGARRSLTVVAEHRSASVHQIALAWLCAQDHVVTIPMSANRIHQSENLLAADIELSAEEMAALD